MFRESRRDGSLVKVVGGLGRVVEHQVQAKKRIAVEDYCKSVTYG